MTEDTDADDKEGSLMTVTPAQLEDHLIDAVLYIYPDADVTYGDERIVRNRYLYVDPGQEVSRVCAQINYPDERVTFRIGVNGAGPFVEIWHPGALGTTVTGWACPGGRIDPTVDVVYRADIERLRKLKTEVHHAE